MLKFINKDKEIIMIEHDDGNLEILNEEMKRQLKEQQEKPPAE